MRIATITSAIARVRRSTHVSGSRPVFKLIACLALPLLGCSHSDDKALFGEFAVTLSDDDTVTWRLTVTPDSWHRMRAEGNDSQAIMAAVRVGFGKMQLNAQGCHFTGSRRELNGDIRLEGTCRWSGAKLGDRRI